MMACAVTAFIRGSNPIWSMVDLNGKQFDDTFYLYVLTDSIPYIPATVYQDDSGLIPWTFPIQFLGNGTLPQNIFFANNTFYRLEIRQNVGPLPRSQNDPLIYLIPDYNPGAFWKKLLILAATIQTIKLATRNSVWLISLLAAPFP